MMGSAHVFHDTYIDKEENSKLQEVVFRWLTCDDIILNSIDSEDPEVRSITLISIIVVEFIVTQNKRMICLLLGKVTRH